MHVLHVLLLCEPGPCVSTRAGMQASAQMLMQNGAYAAERGTAYTTETTTTGDRFDPSAWPQSAPAADGPPPYLKQSDADAAGDPYAAANGQPPDSAAQTAAARSMGTAAQSSPPTRAPPTATDDDNGRAAAALLPAALGYATSRHSMAQHGTPLGCPHAWWPPQHGLCVSGPVPPTLRSPNLAHPGFGCERGMRACVQPSATALLVSMRATCNRWSHGYAEMPARAGAAERAGENGHAGSVTLGSCTMLSILSKACMCHHPTTPHPQASRAAEHASMRPDLRRQE